MGWFIGTGLRETIQLDAIGAAQLLNNFLRFEIGGVIVPTGLLLTFLFFCLLVWIFTKSKSGIAITAGGMSPKFAKASGLDIDRNRIIANIISTVLAAIGIIVYSQSYGYAQLYSGPLLMVFFCSSSNFNRRSYRFKGQSFSCNYRRNIISRFVDNSTSCCKQNFRRIGFI